MAFTKNTIDLLGIPLTLMLLTLPSIAANIDCNGKSFHCVNSTHFIICVDLGSGVSITIDDFVIPCPPPTVCQRTNKFECDFPVDTVGPIVAPTVKSVSEPIDTVSSPYESVTSVPIEKYLDTSTEPTLSKDVLITHQTTAIVTESTIQLVTDASQNNELIITRNETARSTEIQNNFTNTTFFPNNVVVKTTTATTSVASDNIEKKVLETKLNTAVTENILSRDSLALPNNISVSSFKESLGNTENVNSITHESITNSSLNDIVPSETDITHTSSGTSSLPFETTRINDVQTNVTFNTLKNTENLNDIKSGFEINPTFDATNTNVTENVLSTEASTLQNNTNSALDVRLVDIEKVNLITNESINNSMLNKTFASVTEITHTNSNIGLSSTTTEITPSLGGSVTSNHQPLSILKGDHFTKSITKNTENVNNFKSEFEINSTFSQTDANAFETEKNSSIDYYTLINNTTTSTLDVYTYETEKELNKTKLSTTETSHVNSSFGLPSETPQTFIYIDGIQNDVTKPYLQPISTNAGANTTTGLTTNSTKNVNVIISESKTNSTSNKTNPNIFLNDVSKDVLNNGSFMKVSAANSTMSTHEGNFFLNLESTHVNDTEAIQSIPHYSTILIPTNSHVNTTDLLNATEKVNIITTATENISNFHETTPDVNNVQYVSSTSTLNILSDYATDNYAPHSLLSTNSFSNVYNVTESTLIPMINTYNANYLNNSSLPIQINYTTTETIINNVTDMLTETSSNSRNSTAHNTINISTFNTVMPSPTTETITELLTKVTEMNQVSKMNTPISNELTTVDTYSTQDTTKTPEISNDYSLIASTPSADVGQNESTLPLPRVNNYNFPTTPVDTKLENVPTTQRINDADSYDTIQNKTYEGTNEHLIPLNISSNIDIPYKQEIDPKRKLNEHVQNVSVDGHKQTEANLSETTKNSNIVQTETIQINVTLQEPKANVSFNVTVRTAEDIVQNYSVSLKSFTLHKNNTDTTTDALLSEVTKPSVLDDIVHTSYPTNSTSPDTLVNTVTELPLLNVTDNVIIKETQYTLINSSLTNPSNIATNLSNSSLLYKEKKIGNKNIVLNDTQQQPETQNTTASKLTELNSNFLMNDVSSADKLEVATNLTKVKGAVTFSNMNITIPISFEKTTPDLGNTNVETHTKTIDVSLSNSYVIQLPNHYVGSTSKLFIETSTQHTDPSGKDEPVNIPHTSQTLNVLSVDNHDLDNITGSSIKLDTTTRTVNRGLDTKNTDTSTKQDETSDTKVSEYSNTHTQATELIGNAVIINPTVSSATEPTEIYYTSTKVGNVKSDTNKSIFTGSVNIETTTKHTPIQLVYYPSDPISYGEQNTADTMILPNITTLSASTVPFILEQKNVTATVHQVSHTKSMTVANHDKVSSNIISTPIALGITVDYPSDPISYGRETTTETIILPNSTTTLIASTVPFILKQVNMTATVKAPLNIISTLKVLGKIQNVDLAKDILNTSATSKVVIQENKDVAWRELVVTKPFNEVTVTRFPLTKNEKTDDPQIKSPFKTDAVIISNKQNETVQQVTISSEIEKPLIGVKLTTPSSLKESWSKDLQNGVGIKQAAINYHINNTQSKKDVPISVTEFINTYPVTQKTKQLITNSLASNNDVDIVVMDATKKSVPLSTKSTYSAITGKQTRHEEIESFEQPERDEEQGRSEYEESKREKEEERLEAVGELNNMTPKTRKMSVVNEYTNVYSYSKVSTQNKIKFDRTVEMTTRKVELSNSHFKPIDNLESQHTIVKSTDDFEKVKFDDTIKHTTSVRENDKKRTVNYPLSKSKLNVSVTELTKSGFVCKLNSRGKFSDKDDCRKFYICMGKQEPVEGLCPNNTVFSELRKQCTKNLSHCVRNNQFQCVLEGRFSDYFIDNIYYICVKNNVGTFTRFKLQCQSGYHLNKTSVRCALNTESIPTINPTSKQSITDVSINSEQSLSSARSQKLVVESSNKFECKDVGKFADPNNCRRYYVCSKKNGKSRYRLKKKKCDSDELFHKDKKKCVDAESYDCS